MYKILTASLDAYISNRIVKGERKYNSNTGGAGTLNLLKLYGVNLSGSSPQTELSRLLIKFDLNPIRDLISADKIDVTDSSFSCKMKLFDVYGGQPCPSNYDVVVYPISKSWDEGFGKDINFHSDLMACNWISSSYNVTTSQFNTWELTGAASGGIVGSTVDYVTSASLGGGYVDVVRSQHFSDGTENLELDITSLITGTLNEKIPDEGFRISFDDSLETDQRTYFVKRFGSRTAYDKSKRPRLIVMYDDSIITDQLNLNFDVTGSIYLYNNVYGSLEYITSGSSVISGSNCLLLRLETPISGGYYTSSFSGSSVSKGIYMSTIDLDSTVPSLSLKLAQTGSVAFSQIWSSLDETVGYMTGSMLTVNSSPKSNNPTLYQNYSVKVTGTSDEQLSSSTARLRVYIEDIDNQFSNFSRKMIETPGLTIRDVYYSVRNYLTNEVWIPFETTKKSTRLSSDTLSMYFDLDMSSLPTGGTYVIDIKIMSGGAVQTFRNVSPPFRVVS